jgi:uncharacterized protein YyaL (SSP411 family)
VDALAAFWDVNPQGNWEGRSILHAAGERPDNKIIAAGRSALLAARERRTRPSRDEKQLAAWNGLLLRALAEAGAALGKGTYLEAAHRQTRFLRDVLLRPDGRLWRTARGGVARTPAFLEDYACVADGLLASHAALGAAEDLLLARELMERAIADFWDEESGTFWDTSSEHEAIVARPRSLVDGATPSGNAVAADVLLKLALLTGETDFDRRARSILRAVAPAVDRQPSAFGRMLGVAERAFGQQVDVVVAAQHTGDADASALRRAALLPYTPDLVVAAVEPGSPLADWPLFTDKTPRDGRATGYVCRGYACEAPTSDPAEVMRQVRALGAARMASVSRRSAGEE